MSYGKSSSRGFKFSEGDWTCPGCGNINFARRTHCNRCNEEKKMGVKKIKSGGVQIGKQAAEKSKGLFSADDWMCKTCGNVNWARRSECNMCNTPKIGLQDERTGLGGGFNEREGVEYVKREESDDEYDVFGRRKRNKNKENGAYPREEIPTSKKKEESEEEESDEDSDEGDLSKYDLDGDDDDEDDEDEDVSKYDIGASDDDEDSRSRSPNKRRHSSTSSDSDDERSKRKHRRSRSRSRSRSSSSSSSGSERKRPPHRRE